MTFKQIVDILSVESEISISEADVLLVCGFGGGSFLKQGSLLFCHPFGYLFLLGVYSVAESVCRGVVGILKSRIYVYFVTWSFPVWYLNVFLWDSYSIPYNPFVMLPIHIYVPIKHPKNRLCPLHPVVHFSPETSIVFMECFILKVYL